MAKKKKKVSYQKAKEHFKKLPKKVQQRDMARKSKKPYEKHKIPASYVKKGGHRRGDVKDLDTPTYTYGRRGVRLKSVYQLRRILKGKVKNCKSVKSKKNFIKKYEKETKPLLDKLKDSDVKGLFVSYGDKEKNSYSDKKPRVRKIKGFKGEEFTGLRYNYRHTHMKDGSVRSKKLDTVKIDKRKVYAVEGIERRKKKKGLYLTSSTRASHRDDPMYADY